MNKDEIKDEIVGWIVISTLAITLGLMIGAAI